MRIIALPVLMATWACTEANDSSGSPPFPLVPGGATTPTPPEITIPPPTAGGTPVLPPPYLGGANLNAEPYESTVDRCIARPDQTVPCIDVDLFPPQWTLEAGYESMHLSPLTEDINGDGLLDAELQVVGPDAEARLYVFAPLVRQLVLPRDADLSISDDFYCWFGDWNVDGHPDAVCYVPDPADPDAWWAPAIGFVPGPLAGVVEPDLDATEIYAPPPEYVTNYLDTDFDGLVEPAVAGPISVDLWRTSEVAGWLTGPPTLQIEFPCMRDEDELVADDIPPAEVWVCPNDDEGDGVLDLYVTIEPAYGTDCNAEGSSYYLVPANAVGLVDLDASSLAKVGRCLDPVGDQDGDGIVDFHWGDSVFSGPTTWVDGSHTSAELFAYHPDFTNVFWTGVDFTGDGIDDWWGERRVPGLDADIPFTILSGGIAGGVTTGVPAWQIFSAVMPVTAYTEAGTNYVLLTDDFVAARFVPIE